MPSETKYKRIVCRVNKGQNYKVHAGINTSQIKAIPRIIARTYTIISEYMRYKYNPNSPYQWGRALKI